MESEALTVTSLNLELGSEEENTEDLIEVNDPKDVFDNYFNYLLQGRGRGPPVGGTSGAVQGQLKWVVYGV